MEPRPRSVGIRGRVQTDDGLLWKRRRSATSTAEEFVDARILFMQIHEDAEWSPWVLDDRAPEIERAMAVMRQWQRAEPGFRLRQLGDVEAEWAREDEERAARIAQGRQARERPKEDYDPALEQSRLVLLELEGWLAMEQFQRQGLVDETLFPSHGRGSARRPRAGVGTREWMTDQLWTVAIPAGAASMHVRDRLAPSMIVHYRLAAHGCAVARCLRTLNGHRAQGTGHRAQGTGHRAQGTGHRAQGTGHRAQGTGHRALSSSDQLEGQNQKAVEAWARSGTAEPTPEA